MDNLITQFTIDVQSNPLIFLLGLLIGYLVTTTLLKYFRSRTKTQSNFTNIKPPSDVQAKVTDASLIEGEFYIKGSRGNKFCSDDPTGLICNKDFPSGWEKFYIYYIPETQTHIIQGPRGYFCNADQKFGLICNQSQPSQTSTQFKLVPQASPAGSTGVASKIFHHVKIFAHEAPLACADHGKGVMCNHRDDLGYDVFTLIPAAYVENTPMDAKKPRNERLLPITGSVSPVGRSLSTGSVSPVGRSLSTGQTNPRR